MNKFNEALVIAAAEEQKKQKEKNAKKAYIADLIAQGIDKTIAKAMADTFFEYGIVSAL